MNMFLDYHDKFEHVVSNMSSFYKSLKTDLDFFSDLESNSFNIPDSFKIPGSSIFLKISSESDESYLNFLGKNNLFFHSSLYDLWDVDKLDKNSTKKRFNHPLYNIMLLIDSLCVIELNATYIIRKLEHLAIIYVTQLQVLLKNLQDMFNASLEFLQDKYKLIELYYKCGEILSNIKSVFLINNFNQLERLKSFLELQNYFVLDEFESSDEIFDFLKASHSLVFSAITTMNNPESGLLLEIKLEFQSHLYNFQEILLESYAIKEILKSKFKSDFESTL